MCIPPKQRPANWKTKRGRPVVARKDDYQQRYKVERSFAWLGNFRRLLIRWEHLTLVYESWFTVAVLLICLRRVCRDYSPASGKGTGKSGA
jgi:transposase